MTAHPSGDAAHIGKEQRIDCAVNRQQQQHADDEARLVRHHVDDAVADDAEQDRRRHQHAIIADAVRQDTDRDADDDIHGRSKKDQQRVDGVAETQFVDADNGLIGRGGSAGEAEQEDCQHADPHGRVAHGAKYGGSHARTCPRSA
ncbi:hypothetical protein D9M72_542410 [compost metagenome]